ncbi:MAG: Rieske 2Fe-2S domain-containing protein [Planctomycetaceae bacterium]|nr:Rieske 2Fe-2S domain-containing protein [Planctomycetaceae bacterium]
MSNFVRVCSVDELTDGAGREYAVEGQMLALFRIGDEVFAMDGLCPHAGGPIGTGTLRKDVVTCPWHGWQLNVRTGQHCLSANIKANTFPVEIRDGEVFVEL